MKYLTFSSRLVLVGLVWAGAAALAQQGASWDFRLSPLRKATLDRISADSMKGHLSFLASDLLEGRATPSRGLDLAAEYIAAQFRRYGVAPGVGDSYFQKVPITVRGQSEPANAHNVVGIVRGSDPVLKDTYLLISAHYDHLGSREVEGDGIYNGANDDGSGTVAVIELAAAFARSETKPKRSLVFLAFCGEERGLVGSRFYGANPVYPLERTIAMVNLEHIGRTDDLEGPRVGALSMTGYDFSDLGPLFAEAGKQAGVEVQKHARNSDSFFARSDNVALAALGVPAHTLCTAFLFPEYHQPGDHWEKVDFANMEKVVRAVAVGLWGLADSQAEPKWNESNPKAERYLRAWRERHGLSGPPAR